MTPIPRQCRASLPPHVSVDRLGASTTLDRIDRLFSVRLASHWIRQKVPAGKWHRPDTPFDVHALRSVLAGGTWIGFGARRDGRTRWVSIDVDLPAKARTPSSIAERDRITRAVLATLKPASPLIVETPSGGLRIVVAIPETELAPLLDWDNGAVAHALSLAGLAMGCGGDVELYPHRSRGDRLLIGAEMPELDPRTLTRVEDPPPAANSQAFADYLERRLRRLEELAAAPDRALLTHMLSKTATAQSGLAIVAPAAPIDGADHAVQVASALSTTTAGELLTQGLSRPNSRYASEWLVAKILVCDPLAPMRYGAAPHDGTVAGVARALAEWLAFGANGYSEEWRRSLQANRGDVDLTIALWQARYMAGAELEDSLIHRARRAAATRGPGGQETLAWSGAPIAEDAWRVIHAGAVSSQLEGAGRFRFGVWSICLLTAAALVARYHLRRGRTVSLMLDGRHWLRVPICTRWMASWPGGAGIRGDLGERSHKQYLRVAVECGLVNAYPLAPATKAVRSAFAVMGETESLPADEYLVMPLPEHSATRYGIRELIAVSRAMPRRNARSFHPMEVQHLLLLQDSGVRWGQEFGRATGHRLKHQAECARREMEHVRAVGIGGDRVRPVEVEALSVDAPPIERHDVSACSQAA